MTRPLAAVALWAVAALAFAQADYPTKPVRYIVPFAPGGTTDILARIMGQEFASSLKQPFLVENRAGAGGNLGAAEVARAAPDGYTILMGTPGTQAINQFLYSKMPYNTEKDFAPVVFVASVPNVLIVHPSLGVKTLKELIDKARAKPGSINYATPVESAAVRMKAPARIRFMCVLLRRGASGRRSSPRAGSPRDPTR